MHKTGELARAVGGSLTGDADIVIDSVTHDSRSVKDGTLFVAVRGAQADGHDFVEQAVERGAVALCVDHLVETPVAQLVVPDTRAALGPLAAEVWDHPSQRFSLVGVTGTNGKTTVTHMVEAITTAAHRRTGVIGTVGARVTGGTEFDAFRVPLARTTPEATDLQKLFADMAGANAEVVVMEVSSHALSLERVAGTQFAVGAFTNLSQDHLDFHGTMEDYFAAKARFFEVVPTAVVQADTAWGQRLIDQLESHVNLIEVGAATDINASDIDLYVDHSIFGLSIGGEKRTVRLPIAGRFNIDNALVAAGCAVALGVDVDAIVAGLEALQRVPGRFEHVSPDGPLDVVVDYAHTPDGIVNAVSTGRAIIAGRLIVVFGAGGDRDPAKRPLMGAAASEADRVFVTSDNPRSEDPISIINEIVRGITRTEGITIEPDRRRAIHAAVAEANPGDLVMILGKGHEQGQDVAGVVTPFDDRTVAREAMGVTQ